MYMIATNWCTFQCDLDSIIYWRLLSSRLKYILFLFSVAHWIIYSSHIWTRRICKLQLDTFNIFQLYTKCQKLTCFKRKINPVNSFSITKCFTFFHILLHDKNLGRICISFLLLLIFNYFVIKFFCKQLLLTILKQLHDFFKYNRKYSYWKNIFNEQLTYCHVKKYLLKLLMNDLKNVVQCDGTFYFWLYQLFINYH